MGEVRVDLEDNGSRTWVSIHGRDGKELDAPRQELRDGSTRFEFQQDTDIFGVGFWTEPQGGKWQQYEEVAIEGTAALTITGSYSVVVGPDVVLDSERMLTEYSAAGDVHPLREPVNLLPGRYTPKLPGSLYPNEPLTLEVEQFTLHYHQAPDELYTKTMETLVRGSNELSEFYFRSESGHEVAVIVNFDEAAKVRDGASYRLIDIHRMGPRKSQ